MEEKKACTANIEIKKELDYTKYSANPDAKHLAGPLVTVKNFPDVTFVLGGYYALIDAIYDAIERVDIQSKFQLLETLSDVTRMYEFFRKCFENAGSPSIGSDGKSLDYKVRMKTIPNKNLRIPEYICNMDSQYYATNTTNKMSCNRTLLVDSSLHVNTPFGFTSSSTYLKNKHTYTTNLDVFCQIYLCNFSEILNKLSEELSITALIAPNENLHSVSLLENVIKQLREEVSDVPTLFDELGPTEARSILTESLKGILLGTVNK